MFHRGHDGFKQWRLWGFWPINSANSFTSEAPAKPGEHPLASLFLDQEGEVNKRGQNQRCPKFPLVG